MTTYSLAARVILYTLSSFLAMVLLLFSFVFWNGFFRPHAYPSIASPFSLVSGV